MKLLLTLVCAALLSQGFANSSLTNLESFFEIVREIIKKGDPSKDVPILDPYAQHYYQFGLPGLLSFEVEGYHATLAGLSDFILNKAEFNRDDLTLYYNLTLPRLRIQSPYYSLNGTIYGVLPIYGRGGVLFDVYDLNMVGVAHLRIAGRKSILIDRITEAVFSITSVKSLLTGMLGGGNMDIIVNSIIEDVLPDHLTRFSAQVSALTTPIITNVINSIAWRYDIADLIDKPQSGDNDNELIDEPQSGDHELIGDDEPQNGENDNELIFGPQSGEDDNVLIDLSCHCPL